MSNRKCSCLDMILTNSDFVANSGVLDCNISDHNMVYVTRKKGITIKHKVTFRERSDWGDFDRVTSRQSMGNSSNQN